MINKRIEYFFQKALNRENLLQEKLEATTHSQETVKILQEQQKQRDLVKPYKDYLHCLEDIKLLKEMYSYASNQEKDSLDKELDILEQSRNRLIKDLQSIYKQEGDLTQKKQQVFLELHPGTGGGESVFFSNDLMNMYCCLAKKQHWDVELQNSCTKAGVHIMKIVGLGCLFYLALEHGVHRVQRVPTTESKGRVHTSTAIATVIPSYPEQTVVHILPKELKIDTYRSSGPGGQHVNKTDSAVRITHLPTGLKAECQNGRSQQRNKEQALEQLQAKLLAYQRQQRQQQVSELRTQHVGLRSEKIRTYNFPQQRITDHRIKYSTNKLQDFMAGDYELLGKELFNKYDLVIGVDEDN